MIATRMFAITGCWAWKTSQGWGNGFRSGERDISIGVIAGSAFSCCATAGPDSWGETDLYAAGPA